ncbi:Tm-1-like ATP-binding domain-containing protein [Actinopolyspora mortivallis]|uniref:Tm-1-like ATP-binding domain-containing protein n=1 Tax=Actinopolyspora mortivallis TaxID=33906 RepID=UPI00047B98DA|nr:Tm-1-like ATP-binding domain-containing protein [Actinopolyspora mortivallis]
MGSVYVVGTFDTKGAELTYVTELLRRDGSSVVTVDVSTAAPVERSVTVSAESVAGCHPEGRTAVFTGDRGTAVSGMAEAFRRFLCDREDVAGVLGLGGSGATALVTPAMRALPVGIPKFMVSTVASGDVSGYVDASDTVLLPAVTDMAGLNRISRRVLANAAHALHGAASAEPVPAGTDKPAVALSMFGVTTPCVSALVSELEAEYEPLVFHATGTGGRAMEKLAGDGVLRAALDVTTTEICDLVAGGVMSAGEQRLDTLASSGIPYVGSCGALDMVNFGPVSTVPAEYAHRTLYEHNPQVTLMRTTPEECDRIGRFLADKLNAFTAPVRFLFPEGGFSLLDTPGGPFHDPRADAALYEALENNLAQHEDRRLVRVPYHVNDPEFVRELMSSFTEVVRR